VSQISDTKFSSAFTYDSLGQITGRLQTVAGQQVYQAQFTYDAAGQVTRKVETVAGTTDTYDYTYDSESG
jgi:YD repeat-containing protein